MANSAEFLELLRDHLSGLGTIRTGRMFSGTGIYCDGVMFAFVSDDTLYLKVDEANRGDFEARSLGPFCYETRHGHTVATSYWRAPDDLLDDPDELLTWARAALAAAHRAQNKKPKRVRTPANT